MVGRSRRRKLQFALPVVFLHKLCHRPAVTDGPSKVFRHLPTKQVLTCQVTQNDTDASGWRAITQYIMMAIYFSRFSTKKLGFTIRSSSSNNNDNSNKNNKRRQHQTTKYQPDLPGRLKRLISVNDVPPPPLPPPRTQRLWRRTVSHGQYDTCTVMSTEQLSAVYCSWNVNLCPAASAVYV